MLLTVGFGSGILWLATILGSPDAKVSIWPPLIVCGALAMIGVYMMVAPSVKWAPLPGRAAALAERSKEHPSFRDHVADLHGHAMAVMDTLHRPMQSGARIDTRNPVDLGPAATREFAGHFPTEFAIVEKWNTSALGYPAALQELSRVTEQLIEPLLPNRERGELPPQLLQRIACRNYAIELATLSRGEDGRLNIGVPGEPPGWCVALHPPADDEFVEQIRAALERLPTLPEALDVQEREAAFMRLRPVLMEEMREVIRTHNPGGHCDKCP